jgi:hypothetical protein
VTQFYTFVARPATRPREEKPRRFLDYRPDDSATRPFPSRSTSARTELSGPVSRRSELEAFLGWLIGSFTWSSLASFGADRSFRSRTAWCWNVVRRVPVTGEVHDQIEVDGACVGSLCCLIGVAALQWLPVSEARSTIDGNRRILPDHSLRRSCRSRDSAGQEFVHSND